MIVMDNDGNMFDERRKNDIEVEEERRIENINEVPERPAPEEDDDYEGNEDNEDNDELTE